MGISQELSSLILMYQKQVGMQWKKSQRVIRQVTGLLLTLRLLTKGKSRGFPGGSVVKNPPANAGDRSSIPDLGRSHVPWKKISPCAATAESVLQSPSTATPEPVLKPLCPWALEALLHKKSHCSENRHSNPEQPSLAATGEKSVQW